MQARSHAAGSFWLRREDAGVGHRIEVGPDGMQLGAIERRSGAGAVRLRAKGCARLRGESGILSVPWVDRDQPRLTGWSSAATS